MVTMTTQWGYQRVRVRIGDIEAGGSESELNKSLPCGSSPNFFSPSPSCQMPLNSYCQQFPGTAGAFPGVPFYAGGGGDGSGGGGGTQHFLNINLNINQNLIDYYSAFPLPPGTTPQGTPLDYATAAAMYGSGGQNTLYSRCGDGDGIGERRTEPGTGTKPDEESGDYLTADK